MTATTARSRVSAAVWSAVPTLATVAVSVLAGIVVVALLSDEPGHAVTTMLTGAFDGRYQIGSTLARSTPYLFTGAALAISFRVGTFNLGAEGQLVVGAAAGTAVATSGWSGPLAVVAACLAGAAAGALWVTLPALLRAYAGASEIVVTLMLNFVATLLVAWLLAGPLGDPARRGFPQSETFPPGTRLGRMLAPSTLHVGFVLGIAVCVAGALMLRMTTAGFRLGAVGENPEFARTVGIDPARRIVSGMLLSGAIAGLGGIVHLLGDQLRLLDGFSPGYGLVGILIALLARNSLWFVPVSALFYGWIVSGAQLMEERTDVSREAVSVVQAVLFLLVTATFMAGWLARRRTASTTTMTPPATMSGAGAGAGAPGAT